MKQAFQMNSTEHESPLPPLQKKNWQGQDELAISNCRSGTKDHLEQLQLVVGVWPEEGIARFQVKGTRVELTDTVKTLESWLFER